MSEFGKPLYEGKLQYCIRCCMPETSEGINYDERGVCQSCRSSEMKMHIDWNARECELRKILEEAKRNSGDNYDCMVPISGGKDSIFQLHVLTRQYGMRPLACTFSHNWYSKTGWENLWSCLEKLDVDHIMFTPRRSLVNKIAKKSLYAIGDSCWHCHAGVGAFPLQVAIKYDIKLMIWGESIAEFGSKGTYEKPIEFDDEYYMKVSTKVSPEKMIDGKDITAKDIIPFRLPTKEVFLKAGVRGIHLGDYIFWDGERQVEFIKQEYGWQEDRIEGTYKGYKSVECRMPGVHDYLKFLKRGFGRATDHASQDVRAGIMTREEGFEIIKKYDSQKPAEAMEFYLKSTGLSEEEVINTITSMRTGKAKDLP